MKPSLKALIIAIMVHLALAALFYFKFPKSSEETPPIPEKRFGITLTEALESDLLQKESTKPPVQIAPPKSALSVPSNPTLPDKKIQEEAKSDNTLEPITPAQRDTLPFSVLHHYGEEFFLLEPGEQHYIIDNLQRIRKLNEIVGTKLLRERYHDDVDPLDNNVVEFTLHPDGTISNLHLEKNRIGTPLDELTLQTITLAHSKYPKPAQDTKIRIRVYIIVKE